MKKKYDVVALSALAMDIQIVVKDDVLERAGIQKSVTNLVTPEKQAALLQGQRPLKTSGGPGTNVATGVAAHGGHAALIAKIANDNNGKFLTGRLHDRGVDYTPVISDDPAMPSTSVLVMTTPDKERSFAFISGACERLLPEDVDTNLIRQSAITYLDSYLWNREEGRAAVCFAAVEAKKSGGKVAIAINDINMVAKNRATILELARENGDALMGDLREFQQLFNTSTFEETVKAAQALGCIASMTVGKDGAYIVEPARVTHVPCEKIKEVVDTSGAGDQFAAGFLYGLAQGKTPAEAGHVGAVWASEIIQHMGAEPRKHKGSEPHAPKHAAKTKGPAPQ